eukprot:8082206-Lingulodinium_polyedra.AAC.1
MPGADLARAGTARSSPRCGPCRARGANARLRRAPGVRQPRRCLARRCGQQTPRRCRARAAHGRKPHRRRTATRAIHGGARGAAENAARGPRLRLGRRARGGR